MTRGSQLLAEAAARWGTPLYVTDLDAAADGHRAYRAYAAAFPGALVAYAVKANPDPQLLRRLAAEGAGAEVVTAVELALARRAGVPPERIVMNGVGKRDEELHLALGAGVLINAESLEELGALLALAADHPDARIGLRLNPGLDAGTHPHLATGAAESKFGIALDDLPRALAALRAAGRQLHSLGAHIGSDLESAEPFASLA
ncbi:MAG: diaminopimelate decarboxylase family protein, partial [Candidatus Limnocylindria bacterium]